MSKLCLKRLLAKKETQQLIEKTIAAIASPLAIIDCEGNLLMGDDSPKLILQEKYPVQTRDITLGWVKGNEKAEAIANLLGYLSEREQERRELARETLDRYKEINLLYSISDKLTSQLKLEEVAQLVLDEAKRLISATSGWVMLLEEEEGLRKIAAFGEEGEDCNLEREVTNLLLDTGKGEIFNGIDRDIHHLINRDRLNSLIGVPLKGREKILGAIVIGSDRDKYYTAAELKLLNALASQTATAIENAILYLKHLQEERIKSNLERYISAPVVETILANQNLAALQPKRRNVTVLFSDIRNFTTKCEELPPEKIVNYLNEYFTHMVDVIFNHQGTVNKFVGDMIVALFGAPSAIADAEKRAIATAINMQRRLDLIPSRWIGENFLTGIGLSSGSVVVGNVGSPTHTDYTAIGDEVNIASRLQSLAKGGQILVSRSVYEKTYLDFRFREFGTIHVKGKRRSVEVFEVLY
ncbi:MAG: GAF domain-containing protein [Cyanobacteria bacterium SBLK]|nr:GAF domain-containing protein [Cyanobacteria bacterium SBLK]